MLNPVVYTTVYFFFFPTFKHSNPNHSMISMIAKHQFSRSCTLPCSSPSAWMAAVEHVWQRQNDFCQAWVRYLLPISQASHISGFPHSHHRHLPRAEHLECRQLSLVGMENLKPMRNIKWGSWHICTVKFVYGCKTRSIWCAGFLQTWHHPWSSLKDVFWDVV